jgi:hypothetical protein
VVPGLHAHHHCPERTAGVEPATSPFSDGALCHLSYVRHPLVPAVRTSRGGRKSCRQGPWGIVPSACASRPYDRAQAVVWGWTLGPCTCGSQGGPPPVPRGGLPWTGRELNPQPPRVGYKPVEVLCQLSYRPFVVGAVGPSHANDTTLSRTEAQVPFGGWHIRPATSPNSGDGQPRGVRLPVSVAGESGPSASTAPGVTRTRPLRSHPTTSHRGRREPPARPSSVTPVDAHRWFRHPIEGRSARRGAARGPR